MSWHSDSAVRDQTARPVLGLIFWLALSFGVAALGGWFAPGEWYATLQKPSWNPPNWIFGPVWTVLYVIMAIAAWLIWKRGGFARQRLALSLYLAQLLFNALWSPLFFGLRSPALGFVDRLGPRRPSPRHGADDTPGSRHRRRSRPAWP
jgi:tryptophan-rich sensory protein